MDNLNVIDRFMETFVRYIDSGFGLLSGDVATLTTVVIGIDITLVGLAWAADTNGAVVQTLIKKVLYVGFFAFVLNNFSGLADLVFRSFTSLGLNVTNNGISAADLLRPGRLAGIGYDAALPLLQQAGSMMGFSTFFDNVITILVLLFAWMIVICAFFILSVQLFITVLEFKLTTLAGFVLVPFALWNKSAFLAERVLGNVISSGIKVMVLAVIVGIGAGFFGDFINALNGQEPSLAQAMSLVLASISLFALGIFGPGIASGLVSGAPQLGAGAAVGAAGAAGAAMAIGAGAAMAGAKMAYSGSLGALKAGSSIGGAASTAYKAGQAASGAQGFAGAAAGLSNVARTGAAAMGQRLGPQTGSGSAGSAATPHGGPPAWARNLRSEQRGRAYRQTITQAIKEGDKGGAAANPSLSQEM